MKKLGIALAAFAAGVFAQSAASNFDKWWTPEKDATVAAPANHKILITILIHIHPDSISDHTCLDQFFGKSVGNIQEFSGTIIL